MHRSWQTILVAGVSVAGSIACSTDAVSPPAFGSVSLVSGDTQVGTPGVTLDDTLAVKVLDQTGRIPMSGVAVQWSAQTGGGTLRPIADTTDAEGIARATWTLGPLPGTNQAVATVADYPGVEFAADAEGLRAQQVTVGINFACAVDLAGKGWCWGGEWTGQLGNGTDNPSGDEGYRPGAITGGHTFIDIAASFEGACALDTSGTAWCWGLNQYDQLGNASMPSTGTPTEVAGAPPFHSLVPDPNGFTSCALTADSIGYCWGNNAHGELGTGSAASQVATPQAIAGGLKFRTITLGSYFGCGIVSDGSAWCWGAASTLGSGASSNSSVPVPVAGGFHYTDIAAGPSHVCGRTLETGWVCWGPTPTPSPRPALNVLTEYAPGDPLGGGVRGGRGVMVFGIDSLADAGAPLPLYNIRASDTNACGLAANGLVYCWGWNDSGQQGNPLYFHYEPGYWPAQPVVAPGANAPAPAPSLTFRHPRPPLPPGE